eukprot:INCI19827.2.p1 GENE.INCI19827.2~~INCI19827.2.p1  ORF type:complete len:401 (+),score=61.02 INCI19827.2:279-1481(+)
MSREQESFLQAFSNDLNGLCNKFQGRWKLSAMFGTHGPAIKQSASSESMRSLLQQLAPLTETHAVEVVTQLLQQVSEDAWASVVSYLFRNLAEVPRENLPDLWHLLLEQCSTDTTPITAPSVAFAGSIGPHLVGVARQDENTMPAMLLTVGRMRMARMLRKPKWPISVRGMWQPLSHRDSLTISVSPSAGRPTTQCWLQRQFSRNAAASSNNTVFLLLKGDALLGSSSTPVPDFAEDGDDGTNIFDFIFTVNVSGSAMVRIRRHKPSADDAISPENDWVVATLEAGAGDEEATDANPTGPAVVKVFNRENLQGGIEMSVSKITVFVEESMPSGQEKSAERDGHRPIPDASTASDGEPLHGAACNLDEEATAPLLQGPTISWPGAQQWTILGHVEECYDTD